MREVLIEATKMHQTYHPDIDFFKGEIIGIARLYDDPEYNWQDRIYKDKARARNFLKELSQHVPIEDIPQSLVGDREFLGRSGNKFLDIVLEDGLFELKIDKRLDDILGDDLNDYHPDVRFFRDAVLRIALRYDQQEYDGPVSYGDDEKFVGNLLKEISKHIPKSDFLLLFSEPRKKLGEDANTFLDFVLEHACNKVFK